MERFKVEQREASIVLVGEFDPLLMTPQWFVNCGMIPAEDIAENLAIEIIYKDLTRFTIENVQVEIQQGTLVLRSDNSSFDYKIHDLAVGVLNVLKRPKITAIGLNISEDMLFDTLERWHKVGDLVTPKDLWLKTVPGSAHAGMASLQMQIAKPETENGVFNFSVSWLQKPKAIRFSLNNHFDDERSDPDRVVLKGSKATSRKFEPAVLVSAFWDQTFEYYERLVSSLLSQVEGE